ncbi:MAG: c-type cytochrome [Bryobacteraceae bacterium]
MAIWTSNKCSSLRWICVFVLGFLPAGGTVWLVAQNAGKSEPTAQSGKRRPDAANDLRLINSIKGADLYRAYCASCHGADAKGSGPMAGSLKVKPSDLTRISERNNGAFPFPRVQKIISGEQQLPSGHGSREMPVWGPVFSQVTRDDMDLGRVRIDNLTRYLRDIQRMEEVH